MEYYEIYVRIEKTKDARCSLAVALYINLPFPVNYSATHRLYSIANVPVIWRGA